jgi:hypothetical protein
MRPLALGCLLVAACGPVLLYGERDAAHQPGEPAPRVDAGASDPSTPDAALDANASADSAPRALIAVRATDCGRCFELIASGIGGTAPYRYEWDDGSQLERRSVCTSQASLSISLTVIDAASVRSATSLAKLVSDADAGCTPPPAPTPTQRLCIENPSFDGTPAANLGAPGTFDAPPWSDCSNPALNNTPDIGDTASAQAAGAPLPTDGSSMVALGEGEQVSQPLCEAVRGGARLRIELDLTRLNLSGTMESETIHLEIWGGIAADCTQHQLLWASEALSMGWKTYCVALEPVEYMDQITLRSVSDDSSVMLSYLLMDNLVPVDDCP